MSADMGAVGLDARYGRSPERRRRGRAIAVAAAVLGGAAVLAWAVWAGVGTPGPVLESRFVSYTGIADDGITIRFEVSATPGSEVVCALAAQNDRHAIVGWRVVEIPASEQFTRAFEERVTTSEPPVVGLISECRLT